MAEGSLLPLSQSSKFENSSGDAAHGEQKDEEVSENRAKQPNLEQFFKDLGTKKNTPVKPPATEMAPSPASAPFVNSGPRGKNSHTRCTTEPN